jgi:transposase
MRNLVSLLWSEWKDLEQQIVAMNEEVEQIASSDPACQRLRQIPGIGPLVATAIVAAIGNGAAFHKGREFSSWLGFVPRQHSTGGRARLFGIRINTAMNGIGRGGWTDGLSYAHSDLRDTFGRSVPLSRLVL